MPNKQTDREEENLMTSIKNVASELTTKELEEWKTNQESLLAFQQKFVDNGFASKETLEESKEIIKIIDKNLTKHK